MERRHFLRGLGGIFATGALFTVSGCTEDPIIESCQRDKVGTVTVKNSTGYTIYTDVTWGDYVDNYEKRLSNGSSYKYNNVAASGHPESYSGRIEIWASFDGDDWYYEYENLTPCENLTFTWYLSASKSTSPSLILATPNGELVTPTLKQKR